MDLMGSVPENNKKVTKIKLWFIIVIVLIVLLLFSAIGIWLYIQNLNKNEFKFYIDGVKQSNYSENLFLNEEDKMYISVKDLAPLLGYRVYNGGYGQYTEDTTKCYMNNSKEVVSFESNSSKIYKYNVLSSSSNDEGQAFGTSEPIKLLGTNLYVTSDAVCKAFNVMINSEENSISVFSIDYLANYYSKQIKMQQ